eukprot:TRINITY_DN32863_c0_g1_i1.p1 TRINITY_DN32863_c0_g1~~TRINITY_DN32863_c0_g1_i1.p1  ORF type:complete len:213 (-),score=98.03 TRINITY_DN32863_c0_g1_i1:53-667(-)
MSILEYNGSGVVAMCGKNCVAIASDMRYGVQQTTVATDMHKVYKMHDKVYIGMAGLATDMQTLVQRFRFRLKMYELREERKIKPNVFANLVSSMLYQKRFGPYFVEPVIAGLGDKNKPFICAMDLIGAPVYTDNFLVSGTSSEELYGVCEAMYRPNLEPDDLFETVSQCLQAAVDRDCLAGWGAEVYVICPDRVIHKTLKSRQD